MTRVRGVRVGHAEDPAGRTGVTVVRFEEAAPTAVDVRGGASCTYDIASLDLDATFGRRWALFFSGGSVFGLDAARGVRTSLLSAGLGHRAFRNPTLIAPISGACLFDLPTDEGPLTDYLPLGFAACESAVGAPVPTGRRGAGAGAAIGKYRGRSRAMPGGIGSVAVPIDRGHSIGALAVVNSVGAVRDPATGLWIAGARGRPGRIVPPGASPRPPSHRSPARGTTLVSIVTDLAVDRRTLRRVAVAGQSAVARVTNPAHSATDGDVVFVSATRESNRPFEERYPGAVADELGHLASRCVEQAILQAARLGAASLAPRVLA